MNYFENFNGLVPMPPALPTGWTSTSTTPAAPWDRVLISGLNYAASATEVTRPSESLLNSPPIPIGPLGGTLTFDNLYNLEAAAPFVSALAIQTDGKILVGGVFSQVDGFPRQNLVRLNADGTVDPTFHVDTNGQISIIVVDSFNQMIYVGGFFTNIGGQFIRFVARITPLGILDTTFTPNPNSFVQEILIGTPGPGPLGTIYIGGGFTAVNMIPRLRVAKLNYNGSLDIIFNSSANFTSSNRVSAITLDPSNGLLIGGMFELTNLRTNIARLNASTGALDVAFMATTNANVNDIALDISGSAIFVCGNFTTVNTMARNRIAKLDRSDGSLNMTFVPPVFDAEGVTIFLDEVQNLLLLVGRFTTPRTAIAGLDRTTGILSTNPNIVVDGQLFEIAKAPGMNDFIVGGPFTNIGMLSPSIANLALINVQNNTVNTSFSITLSPVAFDGMVLEIKIGAGPFTDIITAGGSFIQGGYNALIGNTDNPLLPGRPVWSGLSGGTFQQPQFIITQVNLPLSAANQLIQLRWILGNDTDVVAQGLPVTRIDNVSIIMNRPICILPGAIVLTDKGSVKIENLKKGDFVFDEHNHKIKVLQNLIIPMVKSKKTVCIRKDAIGPSKPNGEIRITHGHPIKINAHDEERNVEQFVTDYTTKMKIIRSLKPKADFMYNIVTKERVFVNINNIFVATWNQEDLYKQFSMKGTYNL